MARARRNVDEYAGRRVFWEIAGVNLIDDGELVDGSAINVALEHLFQGGACGLHAKLQLLEHQVGLPLDRRDGHFAGLGIEGREAGNVDGVAVTRDRGGRGFPSLEVSRQRLDTNDLSFHGFLRLFELARAAASRSTSVFWRRSPHSDPPE